MARRIFGGEAVPKVFQTFNSLLGGIVRKRNATIVGPSKQLVGEFPEVDFERLYQYYHHWDQIKTSVDVMHQKFRGSGIEVKSNNEYFNTFIEKWWDTSNSEKKWSQFIFSLLITGSAVMELQYTPDNRLANTEQIPMQTIYRIFRDQFGNELKLVQIVDGVFKELDPQFFIHHTINNPDRQAFGKSMFHTLASPRPITGAVDPFTGDAINSARQSLPLLDAQAELQNAEIEIKKKMAKPRLIVSATGMPRDQMEQIQAEMADENTSQYIWIFDKPVNSAELQIQANSKFDEYGNNVDAHIDVGTIFASNVIKNPQGFSYSGSQTPFDVLDQRMADLQSELAETIKDRLLKPLAESWGFKDFSAMEVEVSFTPTMKRLTMEDISGLDPEAVAPKEKRDMYKKINIPLDDQLYDEWQKEMKKDMQDQKNIQMQDALSPTVAGNGDSPTGGENPFKTPPKDEGGDKTSGGVKAPTTPPAKPKTDFEQDRPTPETVKTPQPDNKKPRGESLFNRLVKEIANENMPVSETINAIKALERIPLPTKAHDQTNSSSDLYVSQGIDDVEGKPEITDPVIRQEYGLDKDESELPPSAPAKMARAGDKPMLEPADNTKGRFTNEEQGIPKIPEVSQDEYIKHVQEQTDVGNAHQGGLGNDGISADSDGSFKDPIDAKNDMERTPETGNTAIPNPHPRPNQEPLVDDNKVTNPDEMTMKVSGGSDALPDNTKDQILGGNDNDEQPIVPSEGDPNDNDDEEIKKKIDSQDLKGEAVKPTMPEKSVHTPNTWFNADQNPRRDTIVGEDPYTSGTGEEPTPELNNQPQKGQARLDDSPLQDPSANKGNIDGINPSRDYDNTSAEQPVETSNTDDQVEPNLVSPFDKTSTNVGDSSQVRLQEEERTGINPDELQANDSNSILDNTGLNVKPEQGFPKVSQDDYLKKTQDGSNPLEEEGEPFEDGMIIKPEDVQQADGKLGNTLHNQHSNTVNDPTDSGIDEEQVDPNILHQDPETGINYTDLTDEQGNEVPDLRFDQTPSSDEEQPEVELEYEIVTKEEYDQHLDSSKGQQEDALALQEPMTEDQFNQELENPDPTKPNPFGEDTPLDQDPLDPTEVDDQGNPVELPTQEYNINEPVEEPKSVDKEDKPKKKSPSGDSGEDNDKPKKKSDNDKPKKKASVKDIIKREHELLDEGIDEDDVHEILEEEFGEERMDKAEETKTWKNRR